MLVNLPYLMASSANFLRPTYSYTECCLSFLTGSCPKERTTVSYSSCLLYLIFTNLHCYTRSCFHWTHTLFCFLGFVSEEVHLLLHHLRGSGILLYLCSYATCTFLFISVKSLFGSYVPPLFKIAYITRSILQAITIKDCIFFSGLSGLVV